MKVTKYTFSCLFIFLLLGFSTPQTLGTWTKSNGEQIDAPCPSTYPEDNRLRLPKGCVAQVEGVLLSKAKYIEIQGNLAQLQSKIDTLTKVNAEQKVQIDSLRLDRIVQEVEVKPCKCSKMQTFFAGMSIGTVVTSSACLYFNR